MYESGISWFDQGTNTFRNSRVITGLFTCDAPAVSEVMNKMHHNGQFPCFICEHPGETCQTGAGHNTVFPPNGGPYLRRTKERMHAQAKLALEEGIEHARGIKGPSVVSLISHLDISRAFAPDYMHVICLGVFRMLLSLWCDTSNKAEDYYLKKRMKEQINCELASIRPPDSTMRIPRTLKDIKNLKANEFEEFFIHYFPIILRGKLKKKYFDHFLLLCYGIANLSKPKIHLREIEHARALIDLFIADVEKLYGRHKISYNVHMSGHLSEYVNLYGPLWAWSAFPFEDMNGFVKKTVHGTTRIDIELTNTLDICNAYRILKYVMQEITHSPDPEIVVVPRAKVSMTDVDATQRNLILDFCKKNNTDIGCINLFAKIEFGKMKYTSLRYKRQKKRNNFNIYWRNENSKEKFGIIEMFIYFENKAIALVRELIQDTENRNQIITTCHIRFSQMHILIRESYCLHLLPVNCIEGKTIRIGNYVCIPGYVGKK